MEIKEYLSGNLLYDDETQTIFVKKDEKVTIIAEIRGWAAIHRIFLDNGKIDMQKAAAFQDELGKWITEAIKEKLQKEGEKNEFSWVHRRGENWGTIQGTLNYEP